MIVKNFMTTSLVVIEHDSPITEAKQLLDAHNFRHLPVMENETIVGILSDRDINRSMAISNSVADICGVEMGEDMKIRDIMTLQPLSVVSESSVREVAKIMMEKKIGCLPVIDGDELVGIITETDILRAFMEMVDYIGK